MVCFWLFLGVVLAAGFVLIKDSTLYILKEIISK